MRRTLGTPALVLAILGSGCGHDGGGSVDGPASGPDASAVSPCADGGCGGGSASGDVRYTVGLGGTPFGPGDDGSSGTRLAGGTLTIDAAPATAGYPFIWIANSEEGTLSKIDTRTTRELARYRTGPNAGPADDPSRTTVSLGGDVVVANRAGASATRIAADPRRCVDRNGNGRVDSSTGPADVRPWGEDECVLWHTPFAAGSLARAAAFEADLDADAQHDRADVWIGLWARMQMVKLRGSDGTVLATVDVAPVHPYGAAIDRHGGLWVWGEHVARIDTGTLAVAPIADPPCAYGIAVDEKGRVWTAGLGCVARYSPDSGTWRSVADGVDNRGIALDGRGSVWVADTDFGVHRLDEETMAVIQDLFIPYSTFVGVAVDGDHKVWAVAKGSSTALRIEPDSYSYTPVPVGLHPYTYSDMTGFQLRNAAPPVGRWRHVFPGCKAVTTFKSLGFVADAPVLSSIVFSVRAAASVERLAATPFTEVGVVPGDASPIDLVARLVPQLGADGAEGGVLEVEAALRSLDGASLPVLRSLSVTMDCLPTIQ